MQMERPPFVRLDSTKILADTPEHRVLSYIHVMLKKHGNLPMEEYGRTERIGNRQPHPLVCPIKAGQESLRFFWITVSVRRKPQLHWIGNVVRVDRKPDGWDAVPNDERLDLPPHAQPKLLRHWLAISI